MVFSAFILGCLRMESFSILSSNFMLLCALPATEPHITATVAVPAEAYIADYSLSGRQVNTDVTSAECPQSPAAPLTGVLIWKCAVSHRFALLELASSSVIILLYENSKAVRCSISFNACQRPKPQVSLIDVRTRYLCKALIM